MTNINIPVEEFSMDKLITHIRNSVIIRTYHYLVGPLTEYLNNRYFFNLPCAFIDIEKEIVIFKKEFPLTPTNYIFAIKPHNRIVILTYEDFAKHIKRFTSNTSYCVDKFEPENFGFLKTCDNIALREPVIFYQQNIQRNPSVIKVYHNFIKLQVHSYEYEIPRKVFDMLYVETEDFCPTLEKDSKVVVKSSARHQLYWDSVYLTDLLKSDIGLICDTQDKLVVEYNNITNNEGQHMIKKIIAIHGIAGSGKDTLVSLIKMHIALRMYGHILTASTVQKWLNTAIENIANSSWLLDKRKIDIERFAYPIKECIASFLGIDVDELNLPDTKKEVLDSNIWYTPTQSELTVRDLHTILGDVLKEAFNKNIFATTCLERCMKSKAQVVIINDLRFQEELDVLLSKDVYLIKIQRPEAERERKHQMELNHKIHSSEEGLPSEDFNCIIRNDGTYMDLSIKVADMLLDLGLVDNEYVKNYKKFAETIS